MINVLILLIIILICSIILLLLISLLVYKKQLDKLIFNYDTLNRHYKILEQNYTYLIKEFRKDEM